jgi:hypothetical protein
MINNLKLMQFVAACKCELFPFCGCPPTYVVALDELADRRAHSKKVSDLQKNFKTLML